MQQPSNPTPGGTGDTASNGDLVDDELTYGAAIDELETLLSDLEGADVDVDHLARQVARGVQLVRFCRARLDVVGSEVDAVVSELASTDEFGSAAQ